MTDLYTIDSFEDKFFELTSDFSWKIQGFIDQENIVYPIDSDTKVLSTVFERLASPAMRSIAKKKGYIIETANQTTYPDFTMTKYGPKNEVIHRIAIDIKTTYIKPFVKNPKKYTQTQLTLGSYKSFIRDNTKNIRFPYDTYNEHWILGYVYSRGTEFKEYDLDDMPSRGDIQCPYNVLSIFVRDKVDISSIKAGSGNTANIGSFKINTPKGFETTKFNKTENFETAVGSFSQFRKSKDACNHFWCDYENYKGIIKTDEALFEHPDFQQFK